MAQSNRKRRRVDTTDDQSQLDESGDSKCSMTPDTTDRKKATHLRCERQRREAINTGYQELKELLPSSFTNLGCKTTNASVLFRAAEHIRRLQSTRDQQVHALRRHRAELSAVQVIAEQYERLNETGGVGGDTGDTSTHNQSIRLAHLHSVLARLFESFDDQVEVTDYASLARTLLTWLESTDVPSAFGQTNTNIDEDKGKANT